MKVALVQFAGRAERHANIERVTSLPAAVARGASIVCIHELMSTIYFALEENSQHFALAEEIAGPTTKHFSELADAHGIVVFLPVFESVNGTSYYNSIAVIDADVVSSAPIGRPRFRTSSATA